MSRNVKVSPSGRRKIIPEEYVKLHKGMKNTSKIFNKIIDYLNQGLTNGSPQTTLWSEYLCLPQNSHVEILMPKGDGISRWGLWEVLRS